MCIFAYFISNNSWSQGMSRNLLHSQSYSILLPPSYSVGKVKPPDFCYLSYSNWAIPGTAARQKKRKEIMLAETCFCSFPPGAVTEKGINLNFYFFPVLYLAVFLPYHKVSSEPVWNYIFTNIKTSFVLKFSSISM